MRTLLLHGVLIIQAYQTTTMEPKGNSYSVHEVNQEFSSPGTGDPSNYIPLSGEEYAYPVGGSYTEEKPYQTYPANDYPVHFVSDQIRPSAENSHIYQGSIPSIFTYKPNFVGKDINEYPHFLPPGGKSIEQLQQEADFRLKKLYFESQENFKLVGDKIKKLKETYGYGTIGFPGYRNTIRYQPIDLGTHNGIELGAALDGSSGSYMLPVQTITVTRTVGVRVPQPYPVRQEVPVPAPFPVPATKSNFHEDSIHTSREIKQYLGAFTDIAFAKSDSILGKDFGYAGSKRENRALGTVTPASTKTHSVFRPSFGAHTSTVSETSSASTAYSF